MEVTFHTLTGPRYGEKGVNLNFFAGLSVHTLQVVCYITQLPQLL